MYWPSDASRSIFLTKFVVDAIIFLAPISAFDQVLTEDPKVNRLVRPLLFSQFCRISPEPRFRRIRCFCGKEFAKTSYWLRSISCCSSTSATSFNASLSQAFVSHDTSRAMMIGRMILKPHPNVRLAFYCVGSPLIILGTRLPHKVRRHTKNLFTGAQEILWLLYIYHGEICSLLLRDVLFVDGGRYRRRRQRQAFSRVVRSW